VTVIVTEGDTEKMAVRLLFPTYIFSRNMLDPNLCENQGYDLEYNQMLIDEIDAMRKRDPKGRSVSNAMAPAEHVAGWQSNDGCESSPIFQKCMNRISRFFADEVLPFHGIHNSNGFRMRAGNSWANINEKGSWNRPHLHNGCWYSGVLYIKADGDEGNFEAIDTVPIPNSTLPKVLIPKVTSSPPLDTLFNSKIVEKPTLELCALKYN